MAVKSAAQLRRLGAELKRVRLRAERKQADVAAEMGLSQATIANWEAGRNLIDGEQKLEVLLAALSATDEEKSGLRGLYRDASKGESEWTTYGLPEGLRPYVSFEEEADSIESVTLTVIPGLLQTERYARALHIAAPYKVTPSDVERWVSARLRRQQRLEGSSPLKLHAVIPEATLSAEVGGGVVMVEQLTKLVEYCDKPHITIQVIPSARGAHSALACGFVVLNFRDSDSLGYYDSPFSGNLVSRKHEVDFLRASFEIVCDLSLSPPASKKLIQKTLDRYARRNPQP